jgi:hypothetical protein
MRIEKIENINIEIEGKNFSFSYEELADISIILDDSTVNIKVKPNETIHTEVTK